MTTTPAPKGADIEQRDLLDEDGENRAVRSFLMQYSCDRSLTIGAMQDHMKRSGFDRCWPSSFYDPAHLKHLTKAGAQIWIRHLFSLESGSSTSTSQGDLRQTQAETVIPASVGPLTETEIECMWHEACLKHLDLDDSAIPEFARAIEAKVASRCRAQGGNTSGLLEVSGSAETRMDSGFEGGHLGGNSGAAPGDAMDARDQARRLEITQTMLEQERMKNAHLLNVMMSVYSLTPNGRDIKLPDGSVFRFNDPDAAETLNALGRAIRAIPEKAAQALANRCGCQNCNPHMVGKMMFICPKCGDKRCPHASNHESECSAIAASTSKGEEK